MHKELPLTDVHTLRARARANIEEGAVTTGYAADRATVLRLLDELLATRWQAWFVSGGGAGSMITVVPERVLPVSPVAPVSPVWPV